jgi:hypothetical protein
LVEDTGDGGENRQEEEVDLNDFEEVQRIAQGVDRKSEGEVKVNWRVERTWIDCKDQ